MVPSLQIALADDDPSVRDCVKLMLERLGHRVAAFADGAALIDACYQNYPDLVVSDVQMPKLDGVAAAEIIGREFAIPFILMSAGWTEETEIGARRADAICLCKPLSQAALASAIALATKRMVVVR